MYSRFFLPVSRGDTTLTVSISSFGQKCGLMGRHTYTGASSQMAVNFSFVQIALWQHGVSLTSGTDVLQPACPIAPPWCADQAASRIVSAAGGLLNSQSNCDAPEPPNGNGGGAGIDPIEVCYTIWREYWHYDFLTRRSYLVAVFPIGVQCYTVGNMT
jgi:hypothetical protein